MIWFSILGVAPFALLLPHADLFWTTTLTIVIGLVLSSAFSAFLVYAQELMPGKAGTLVLSKLSRLFQSGSASSDPPQP